MLFKTLPIFSVSGFRGEKTAKKSVLFHCICGPRGLPPHLLPGCMQCSNPPPGQLCSRGRHLAHVESGPCLVLPARVCFSLNPGQFGCLSTSAFQRGQETYSLAVCLDFFMVILGAAVQRTLSISFGNWAASAFLWGSEFSVSCSVHCHPVSSLLMISSVVALVHKFTS